MWIVRGGDVRMYISMINLQLRMKYDECSCLTGCLLG